MSKAKRVRRERTKPGEIPKILHRKDRDLAFILIEGRRFYLGPYGSLEAEESRLRVWNEYKTKRGLDPNEIDNVPVTVSTLVNRFLDDAKTVYVKHGRSTGSYERFVVTVRPLFQLYADYPVASFTTGCLKAVREVFIGQGMGRKTINSRTDLLRQIFRWGVENELVEETTWRALTAVSHLKAGKTTAPDYPDVEPVADEIVNMTIPFMPSAVQAILYASTAAFVIVLVIVAIFFLFSGGGGNIDSASKPEAIAPAQENTIAASETHSDLATPVIAKPEPIAEKAMPQEPEPSTELPVQSSAAPTAKTPTEDEIDIDFESTRLEKVPEEEQEKINSKIRDFEQNQKIYNELIFGHQDNLLIGNITRMKGGIRGLSLQRNGMGGIGGPFRMTLNRTTSFYALVFLRNDTEKAIKSATFKLTMTGKGRTVPYGELVMVIKFSGGIEPKEIVSSLLTSISKDDALISMPTDRQKLNEIESTIKLVGFTFFDDEEVGRDALHPDRN